MIYIIYSTCIDMYTMWAGVHSLYSLFESTTHEDTKDKWNLDISSEALNSLRS